MSEHQSTPAPNLLAAADALLDAYRARYTKPATGGIRADAPMRQEMAALNLAVVALRAPRPVPLSPWQEAEAAIDRANAMKGRHGYEAHPDFGKGPPHAE